MMALNPRVLLADGDTSLARTLAWMLKQNNYVVDSAATLELVEARLEAERYELILLDLGLLNGTDVPPILRTAVDARLALLATSATLPDADLCARLRLRPDEVLAKPFQVRDLLRRMAERMRATRRTDGEMAVQWQRGQVAAIFGDIVHARGFDEFATVLVRGVSRALGIPRVSLMLARAGDQYGTVVAASENPTLRDLRIELSRYPEVQRALASDGPILVGDVQTDPLYDRVRELWKFDAVKVETVSAIAMRFKLGQTATGVFFLRTADPATPLAAHDVVFAGRVLEMAVNALEDATAREAAERDRASGHGA